jgi:hypothetical protein
MVRREMRPSGAEAHRRFVRFMYGLKPVPFKLAYCRVV